jgi:hypothetical protein
VTVDESAVQPVEVGCSRKAQQDGTTTDAVSIRQSAGGSSMQEKGRLGILAAL